MTLEEHADAIVKEFDRVVDNCALADPWEITKECMRLHREICLHHLLAAVEAETERCCRAMCVRCCAVGARIIIGANGGPIHVTTLGNLACNAAPIRARKGGE